MDPDLRRRMGEAAIKVVKAANYYNAGTVEFLVDSHRNFYFLEMNTRLQVEHPITELVTGIDLVKQQIHVAAGGVLPFRQEDIQLRGAAIECRVYAEDPANNFFPSPGRITVLRTPSGPGVRDDSGVYEGWTVPIDYDPLISKLAAWGASRDEAIGRMKRALREYQIEGIQSNIAFFLEILDNPEFKEGVFDTGFIDRWLKTRGPDPPVTEFERSLAALSAALFHSERAAPVSEATAATESPWKLEGRRRALRTT
jgi:acetyl-CoA carboxylase biotin carboxylase subunit